jgi:DNA-binding CsgD family transcriptional regulator
VDRLAGRDRELARIRSLLAEATDGSPRALVVHGEAGVGKTRLVRDALAGSDLAVAWGTCVHFGASTVPFAPLVSALRPWLSDTDGDLDAARLIPVVDRTLQRLAAERATVLVVDDLQWADVSSLDALAFLVAGFRDQRLAVLATCRDEDRPTGSVLHGWLADLRRMPGFEELQLGRLDLPATEELVSAHLGPPVDLALVAEVHARSQGNAYLAELLVRDLPPGARRLPRSAPAALGQALTARWHALSPPARTLGQILAVGGRPRERDLLVRVAAAHGLEQAAVDAAVQDAVDKGVLGTARDPVWFRHPLLAEVLDEAMDPLFAAAVHATYAELLEAQPDVSERGRADDLAVHHLRAGHHEDAYRWSIRAADAAAAADSASEAVHLERACALWHLRAEAGRADVEAQVALLRRTARVDQRVGRVAHAVTLIDEARALVQPDEDPRLAASLLTEWCQLVWERDAPSPAVRPELHEALRLVERYPDSAERAHALAALAGALDWDMKRSDALACATEAVSVARRCGSDEALADALFVLSRTSDDLDTAARSLAEGYELARRIGDAERMTDAAIWQVNQLIALDRPREALDVARATADEGTALGSVAWSHFLRGMAASLALELGEWAESRRLLREALALRPVAIPGAIVHLVAARLAALTGDVAEARAHLDRALDLVPEFFAGLRYEMAQAHLVVLIAEGEPGRALDWLAEQLRTAPPADARDRSEFLAQVARAAADAAGAAWDRGDPGAAAEAGLRLDALVSDACASESLPETTPAHLHQLALFRAERARCRREAGEQQCWAAAAATADPAEQPWNRAYALYREAQAASRTRAPRSRLAEPLREAHRIAERLGAHPLLAEIEQLATSARVSLAEVEGIRSEPAGAADPMAGLTDREREVLSHLVAGRSNSEIARALVISEKTVSVHVSNILRKTGTANRVEAAALAGRLS